MITGSWASIDYNNQGKTTWSEKNALRIVTFYPNGDFQEEIANPEFKTWRYLSAPSRWKLNGKKNSIELSKPRSYHEMDFYRSNVLALLGSCKLLRVTHDSITLMAHSLFGGTIRSDSTFLFHRVALRTQRLQNEQRPNDLFCISTVDSSNIKKVATFHGTVTLQLKNDTLNNYLHLVTGSLAYVNTDTIGIELVSEHLAYTDQSGKELSFDKTIKEKPFSLSPSLSYYMVKNIQGVTPLDSRYPILEHSGDAVMLLAASSTLLASPIFASAPHFNSFDVHQFLVFSGVSILSGLIVGVPLLAIGQGSVTEYFLDSAAAKYNNASNWRIKPFVYE